MDRQTNMRAAVVVPVKNERNGLLLLLESLSRQIGDQDEVIFIDAGSVDGSWEMLIKFARKHPGFKVFRENNAYPGRARNMAIKRTNARFIAQIDGGNIPHEQWLAEILSSLVTDRADFIMGDVAIKPIPKTLWKRHVDMGQFYGASLFRGNHLRGRQLYPPAGGASVAYKRWVWEKAGGFPEKLRSGEDRLFARKIMRQNLRIFFAENAVVYWEIGPSLLHFLKRHFYHQRIKFQESEIKNTGIKRRITTVTVAMAMVAFNPEFWPLPIVLLGAAILHQVLKSGRTYYRRSPGLEMPSSLVFSILAVLETLALGTKLFGMFSGILSKKRKRQRQKSAREYLIP